MPIAEWTVPFLLKTPEGELLLNEPQGGGGDDADDLYILEESKCKAILATLRTQADDSPQSDGSIFHRSFKGYYLTTLEVELWLGTLGAATPACDADRVRMVDNLLLHLNALVDPELADLEGGNCQLQWEASGVDPRMLNRLRLGTWPTDTIEPPVMTLSFELRSPFPYAMDVAETVTDIDAAVSVTNAGNVNFFPVFKVHGPFSSFSIQNITDLMFIDYSAAFPGAAAVASGHYIEISTFDNTMFLDGSGANMMAGLDVSISDFWQLVVGNNDLSFTADNAGATCDMLWNNAWA